MSKLVMPRDIITSEHLETLLVVVPKYLEKDWFSSYETLTTYVSLEKDRYKIFQAFIAVPGNSVIVADYGHNLGFWHILPTVRDRGTKLSSLQMFSSRSWQLTRKPWKIKQSEAEKLQKLNEPEGDAGVDGDKEKDDGRVKALKANKDDDDKIRATAANVAALAAVGGDDLMSKWQIMAEEARQKREGGASGVASASHSGIETSFKPSSTFAKNEGDTEGGEKRVHSVASLAFGFCLPSSWDMLVKHGTTSFL